MGVYKFYLGPHKSGKKEKYPYLNFLQHSLYHEYFAMSNTHMKQQVIPLDLYQEMSQNIRKYQLGQLHRIETKQIML